MATQIFVNLPVNDLNASIAFFESLGYSFNPQFTDESATCMIIGESIYAMLMTRERFQGYAPHPVSDAKQQTEVLIALSCESRQQVDEMISKALAAGGTTYKEPEDHGFMYAQAFQDLDGHVWEVFHMDPNAIGGA